MPDSTHATRAHQIRVMELMQTVMGKIMDAAVNHDASKLVEPEKSVFDVFTPRLKHLDYGTPAYAEALKHMKPALDHHYANNRHHPEFHENGIHGMDLLYLIEMLADWKAAGERHTDSKGLANSIKINAERYGYDEGFAALLTRTAERLGWL